MIITPGARAAAARAHDLAYVLLSRSAAHPAQDALLAMVEHLDTAGDSLATEPAAELTGTAPTALPIRATVALMECRLLAEDTPAAGIAPAVLDYVTAPVAGATRPALPPLTPARTVHRHQEDNLRTRIGLACHDLDATSDPVTRYAYLALLVSLHQQHAALTAEIAAANPRPTPRP
ncbi:hypothetical protein [Streptomyces sp. NPDC057250]|uniref:hypothetical protein n=1 Tax=Streptomyces sp. NPDC057250 TaxID=3346068 RepID=UPI003642CCC9